MKILPLGSIVVLKGGFKKLMIIGRKVLQGESEKPFDYLACLYPEGDIGDQYKFIFNNEDIDQIIFEGFEDSEEEMFIDTITKLENEKM